MWLPKCLKSPILEHPLTVKILRSSKHSWNLERSTFVTFFINVGEIESENVSLSDTVNLMNFF